MRATLSPPLAIPLLVPATPLSCPRLFFSLSLSLLFSRPFYLFSLHLHFFTPTDILSERHGHFHRRVSIFSLDGPSRAVDIRASFSRYINTPIPNPIISESRLSYFRTCLNMWIEEIIDNRVNPAFPRGCSPVPVPSPPPRRLASFAYFHANLMQPEEIVANCINFASTLLSFPLCYTPAYRGNLR